MKYVIILLLSALLYTSCSREAGTLQPAKLFSDSIQLLVTKDRVPADGYSYAEISAVVKKRHASNDLLVFKTDHGVFANNSSMYTVNISSNDTTRAFLRYTKADVVRVTTTVFEKDTQERFVTFIPALPSVIIVNPDSATLLPSFISKTKVIAKLSRSSGSVSEGTLVHFYDSTSTGGASIGIFLNNTVSDIQGTASSDYVLQDTSYHGVVYLKAYVDSGVGRVTGVNRIYIR